MSTKRESRAGLAPTQRAVLQELDPLLGKFGVANDAEDRWSGEEAAELRRTARVRIAELLDRHPFLEDLMPTLRQELERGSIESVTWWSLQEEVKAWLR